MFASNGHRYPRHAGEHRARSRVSSTRSSLQRAFSSIGGRLTFTTRAIRHGAGRCNGRRRLRGIATNGYTGSTHQSSVRGRNSGTLIFHLVNMGHCHFHVGHYQVSIRSNAELRSIGSSGAGGRHSNASGFGMGRYSYTNAASHLRTFRTHGTHCSNAGSSEDSSRLGRLGRTITGQFRLLTCFEVRVTGRGAGNCHYRSLGMGTFGRENFREISFDGAANLMEL